MKQKIYLRYFFIFTLISYLWTFCGCQSVAKKFVRKPKVEKKPETIIIAPEEYPLPQLDNHTLYQQYFVLWRSWHDELIDSLEKNGNRKRQQEAAKQAILNLENMLSLLKDDQLCSQLEQLISEFKSLQEKIIADKYLENISQHRNHTEKLRRKISHYFSYNKVKKFIL
ncbi:MAG: hypothetical protein N2606_07710 [Candidatus Omnitrophica bacterium]|nr:hypothetical protein [Candidatus Omnitrophota bacterium]